MKILCIGDIHTKVWILDEVEKLIDNYDYVVFLGDYADNWNTMPGNSMAAWRVLRIIWGEHPDKVRAVLGNHDFAYLHKEISGRSSGYNPITQVILDSPNNKWIKDWLNSLPVVLELEGITFSHAGVTEEWNGKFDVYSLWSDASPIWARPKEMGGYVTYKDIPQVIGHNTSKTIWQPHPKVWCIDTFSEMSDNTPYGDYTVLEIIDGEYKIKKLAELNENNDNTSSVEDDVSGQSAGSSDEPEVQVS